MTEALKLKINEEVFPNSAYPAVIGDFRYNAKRMGKAPSLSATLLYPQCLDNEWSDDVYVEFRGERYYLKQTPASSYDNTSVMYKHNVEFVSERTVLESVYFFDVVKADAEDDKPASNSSTFSFFGDLRQLAARLTYSMQWSGLDYTVVVDDDVELEEFHMELQDQFLESVLQKSYEIFKVPYYFVGKAIHFGYAENVIGEVLRYGCDNALMSISKNNAGSAIVNRATGLGSDRNITYYYPNPTPKGTVEISYNAQKATLNIVDAVKFANNTPIGDTVNLHIGKNLYPDKTKNISRDEVEYDYETYVPEIGISIRPYYHTFTVSTVMSQMSDGPMELRIDLELTPSVDLSASSGISNAKITDGTTAYIPNINGYEISYSLLPKGVYTLLFDIAIFPVGGLSTSRDAKITIFDKNRQYWTIGDSTREYDISDFGVEYTGTLTDGDNFSLNIVKRVNVQKNLMPSIYRETDGEQRFYNAENGVYKDDEGNDIVFANPHSTTRSREHILKDDEIYPSIEGMVNANGLRIDMFSEFAFDENDNDDIYPVGHEGEGKYKHPYFFGKLRKFDGEHGFNMFDHAIEGQPMTISMKSGKCGACNFTIGVDEETSSYNTVQVTEVDKITINGTIPAGTLKRDDEGNVLCGRWPQAPQTKQERQNDTQNYEVWIALKKDIQTFGVVMPNATNAYRPSAGDQFVILNIDLPEAYVTAAEDKLEKAIIDYMAENNDYKFNFSVKFSRIFFEENPDIANLINENAKVTLEYNGVERDLYVSSFAYSASANDALPEVTIELSDDIKIFKSSIQKEQEQLYKVVDFNYKILSAKDNESLKFSQKAETTAKTASTTAQTALESSTIIKTDLKVVEAQATEAKTLATDARTTANKADENATKVGATVTVIGNQIGTMNTNISKAQNTADSAKNEADKANSNIEKVSTDTNNQFQAVNTSISKIEKDVDDIESLIGDEYNIWFEPDTQLGTEPSLSNYPASDWTSDDDYFNHDKDLYYSITLGRAWRFMYNEGSPFWDEITDADTITALTKAQEALTKAQEALVGVSSLDFIKGVFSDDEILNEKAAVLSRLVAVKDINNEVTAGIYGGGVDGLDSAGYKDSSHGTLMMFAGASSASNASNSKFRVYEDGTIFANSGVFGGVIKKGVTIVTPESILDFAVPAAVVYGELVIDIPKIGSYIVFDGFRNNTWFEDYNTLQLPCCYGGDIPAISFGYSFNDLVGLIGVDLIFRATSDIDTTLCLSVPRILADGNISPICVPIKKGDIIIATCTARRNSSDYLNIGWELKTI